MTEPRKGPKSDVPIAPRARHPQDRPFWSPILGVVGLVVLVVVVFALITWARWNT